MSAVPAHHRATSFFSVVGAAAALLAGGFHCASPGCVREVLKGDDPERPGRLTGENDRDSLVVRIPWMALPGPRLLNANKLVRAESVFARTPEGKTRFTLRTLGGVSALVDARSKDLPDGSLEFTYEIESLPAGYQVDVVIEVKGDGLRPDVDVVVNGGPVKLEPGTEVVSVLLGRDEATRIVVTPRTPPAPPPAAPAAKPSAST
jgi:hypothetical protein